MLIIKSHRKQHLDQLLRSYKKKVDETGLSSRIKKQALFLKPSLKNKRMRNKAIATQRYKVAHGLV